MNASPLLSIILPVRNEADHLEPSLRRVRESCRRFPVEIIVVDGQSSDQTPALAQALADRALIAPKPGRALQMHLGAEASRGEFLLFLHADTRLPEDWQEIIEREFLHADGPPVAGAFEISFDAEGRIYHWIAKLANLRTRLTGIPQGDQALLVRRETYFAAGGFPEVPLMEEYIFIPKLRRFGRVRIFQASVATSARRYAKNGPLWNSLKNSLLVLLFYLGFSPRRLAGWYR